MSDKKELNKEELEKVSGGGYNETDPSKLTWTYPLGKTIVVNNGDNNWEKYTGTITKLGYLHTLIFYSAYYYVDCGHSGFDGWYSENDVATGELYNDRKANKEYSEAAVIVQE